MGERSSQTIEPDEPGVARTERPPLWRCWLVATRPKTLTAASAPVFLGTALAVGDGRLHVPSALLAVLGALFIQIGTNFANDYYDWRKGTDKGPRIGPRRLTASGWIAPGAMLNAGFLMFGLALIIALLLAWRAGPAIILIGCVSVICGLLYTAGPWALAYKGLGEVFVIVFFGPVAVATTYYVQALELTPAVPLAGLAPGLLAAALLAVNNLRDHQTDRAGGKMTLAARYGESWARREYAVLLTFGTLIPILIFWMVKDTPAVLASVWLMPAAVPLIEAAFTWPIGPRLNKLLAWTSVYLFTHTALFGLGWVAVLL